MQPIRKWMTMPSDTGPFLSLYMPLHPGRKNSTQDRICLRHLLDTAEKQLEAFGLDTQGIQDFLQPARELDLDEVTPKSANALALLLAPNVLEVLTPDLALSEMAVVAPRPHVMPLLPLLHRAHCFVLALSQKRVRLWRSELQQAVPVELPGVPHSLAEALADVKFEKLGNVRPLPRSVGGGGRQAIAYGQGSAAEALKEEMTAFFRQVDAGVVGALKDEHAPLVVACVDYLFPLYRGVNTYPALWGECLAGNPDRIAPAKLMARAYELLEPLYQETKREAKARYYALASAERATDEIKKVVPAAAQGRVELLMLETETPMPGEFDVARQEVLPHPTHAARTEDMCNLAALHTLRTGGTVLPMTRAEMPGQARMAAVLRF